MHVFVIVIAIALTTTTAVTAQPLQIQRPVSYSEDGNIADSVRRKCRIDEQLADFIGKYTGKNGVDVRFTDVPVGPSSGHVLDVRIAEAIAVGSIFDGRLRGGGPGTLYDGGRKIASFRVSCHSVGGVLTGERGACTVLARTAKVIGEDISNWLKAPVDGARLGEG